MKDNLEYYLHYSDADQDEKFVTLRLKYKWSGEGRFWALCNRIANSEGCWLDLSKKFRKNTIIAHLEMTPDEFDEFIDYLVNDCELLIRDGDCITTTRAQEQLSKVMKKRKTAQNTKKKLSQNPESYDNSGEVIAESEQNSESFRQPDYRAEQSRLEKTREEQQQNSADGYDNSGEVSIPPAAASNIQKVREKIRGITEYSFAFEDDILQEFADRLQRQDVDIGFLDFVVKKMLKTEKRQEIQKPSGYFIRSVMEFDNLIAEYKSERASREKKKSRASPPPCKKCNSQDFNVVPGDGSMCKNCGAFYDWDGKTGSWALSEEQELDNETQAKIKQFTRQPEPIDDFEDEEVVF